MISIRTSVAVMVVCLLCSLFLVTGETLATEEYAESTGQDCGACHVDPLGGGDLTEYGKGYLLSFGGEGRQSSDERGLISRSVRLVVGYLHILTAFLWFGTILYVHLVLKPAYASQGLPRGEVKVGLYSMVIMAVTGSILTWYRVPSMEYFYSSTFGILLLLKIVIFSIMVLSALFVVLIIGPKLHRKKNVQLPRSGKITIEELAGFDGRDGRPAYFAYKGKIYDVSQSGLWKDGSHMQRHQAGVDLTDILTQAPHEEDKVLAMPEVGQLATTPAKQRGLTPNRIFYVMAYMNLGFVFIISFILALWRW